MLQNQFTCAMSGIKSKLDEDDDIEFPDGWLEVKITRRFVNPKWDAIQYVKQGLIAQHLQNIPEEHREDQFLAITIQVEAQFAMIEAQTDQYIEEEVTKYIANPDSNVALMAEYNKLRKMLGLKPEQAAPPEQPPQIEQAPQQPVQTEQPQKQAVAEEAPKA